MSPILQFCEVNQVKIAYESCGEGYPIIFLPGFSLDHIYEQAYFEPFFPPSSPWRRIYLDLPGTGESPTTEKVKNADDLIIILRAFINHIIPNSSFLVVGESYGAYLVRGLIFQEKSRILGAAFLIPAVIAEKSQRTVGNHTIIYQDRSFLSRLTHEERKDLEESAVIHTSSVWDGVKFVNESQKKSNMEYLNQYQHTGYSLSLNLNDKKFSFARPVLFLTGKQDSIVGYKDQWNILDQFPRATYVALDSGSHCAEIEQVEITKVLFLEWLNRVLQELNT